MKMILRVAKTELRTLFYSPIAWFLMIVFLIQCSVMYVNQLNIISKQQELGGYGLRFMGNLTERVFVSPYGLFPGIMSSLYLYIPLLTMSLISRETSSGTIRLLYSSPIKVREIVFGKFFSMMVYNLVLVGIIGIFLVSGSFHIQHPDNGILLSALLGFYLLLCTYAAIGLFMSCLTTYQVVAAISTFVLIGVLSYIGSLWQRIAFVRELTYFLSINGRTQLMLAGLITTKDVIYFIVIIYMFLGFAICKLKSGMESVSAAIKATRYIAIVASVLLIGYVSSIPALVGYLDATANKSRTLTPQVQRILKELGDEPLEVTAYANLLDGYYYLGGPDSYNENVGRWEPYVRFKHNIELKTVAYWDSVYANDWMFKSYPGKSMKEIAEQYAKNYDVSLKAYLTPEQIRQKIDLKAEQNRYVMQLKWKGRTTFLRVFNDRMVWPSETEVAAALKRLLPAQLPKIGFLSGDLERDIDKMGDRDYKNLTNLASFRNSLVNQGFDVQKIEPETADIPSDIAALVLADPKVELQAATMAKVEQYINNGGNILIAGEAGKGAILNPLLGKIGVKMNEGMVMQESKDLAPNIAAPYMNPAITGFSKYLARTLTQSIADSIPVSMPGVAGLSWTTDSGFAVQPLLTTDPKKAWNRIKPFDPETMTAARGQLAMNTGSATSTSDRGHLGTVTFDPAGGDVRVPVTTLIALTRKVNGKEQRIIVAGDADFMSNAELGRFNLNTANFSFNTALFSWLSYGEFPVDTSRPEAKDKRVTVTNAEVQFLRIVYVWVMPGILLACGAILLIRRKRK